MFNNNKLKPNIAQNPGRLQPLVQKPDTPPLACAYCFHTALASHTLANNHLVTHVNALRYWGRVLSLSKEFLER